MPRPLPSRLEDLRVPNLSHPYFDGARARRFDPEARDFHAVNAWWLAEISLLTYVPDARFIGERLNAAGFDSVVIIERDGTKALVAETAAAVVVAFRGTIITDMRNLLTDLDIKREPLSGGGRVHRGFRDALDIVWPEVARRIADRHGRSLWLTGHSMGGALATLAAMRVESLGGLYSFGSPRVGDQGFRDRFPLTRCYRVVNEDDVVTYLPPPMGYRHAGEEIRMRGNGRIERRTTPIDRLRHRAQERVPSVFRDVSSATELWNNIVRENALADHAPVNYAIRLWNLTE